MSPLPRIVLIRHGETEWSRDGRHTGRTDLPLTPQGRAEAAALAPRVASRQFSRVLCSPMRRAIETCHLAGLGEPEIVDDLREWDYGDYEGRTTSNIRAEVPEWTVWDGPVPGGETAHAIGTRADRVIERLRTGDRDNGNHGDIAVISHGHFLRVLGARWIGLPPTAGRHLGLSTAAICELGYERDTPAIWRWNDLCHLEL